MSLKVEIIWHPKDPAETQNFYQNVWGPLLGEFLVKRYKATGVEHALDPNPFTAAWYNSYVTLIGATRPGETKLCGFMLGTVFTPLFTHGLVFNVETWIAENDDNAVIEAMVDFVYKQVKPIQNLSEVRFLASPHQTLPPSVMANVVQDKSYNLLYVDR